MMKRCYVVLVVLLSVGVSAQAEMVINGEFQMYKPGDPTVTADFDLASGNPYQTVQPVEGLLEWKSGLVTYSDGSDGGTATAATLPGWVDVSTGNRCNVLGNGADGTTALNAFGGWGSPGSKVRSSSSLGTITAGESYLLSAEVNANDTGVRILRLLANDVEVVPSSEVNPLDDTGWGEISRTYNAADLAVAGLVGQSITVELGCALPVSGSATQFDNVSLVPEPATMLLLGLGGLLLRRKR